MNSVIKELTKKLNDRDGVTRIPCQAPLVQIIEAILGLTNISNDKISISIKKEVLIPNEIEFDKDTLILDSIKYLCEEFNLKLDMNGGKIEISD